VAVKLARVRQRARGFYSCKPGEAVFRAHSLQILEIRGGAIAAMTKYMKPLAPALFAEFGLLATCERV
jgi:hypothetical protein